MVLWLSWRFHLSETARWWLYRKMPAADWDTPLCVCCSLWRWPATQRRTWSPNKWAVWALWTRADFAQWPSDSRSGWLGRKCTSWLYDMTTDRLHCKNFYRNSCNINPSPATYKPPVLCFLQGIDFWCVLCFARTQVAPDIVVKIPYSSCNINPSCNITPMTGWFKTSVLPPPPLQPKPNFFKTFWVRHLVEHEKRKKEFYFYEILFWSHWAMGDSFC